MLESALLDWTMPTRTKKKKGAFLLLLCIDARQRLWKGDSLLPPGELRWGGKGKETGAAKKDARQQYEQTRCDQVACFCFCFCVLLCRFSCAWAYSAWCAFQQKEARKSRMGHLFNFCASSATTSIKSSIDPRALKSIGSIDQSPWPARLCCCCLGRQVVVGNRRAASLSFSLLSLFAQLRSKNGPRAVLRLIGVEEVLSAGAVVVVLHSPTQRASW